MGRLGSLPAGLGMCGNVPRQRRGGSGEKSLRVESAGSVLWDQGQHQSGVTSAKPSVSPLEPTWIRASLQLGFLLSLHGISPSPFNANHGNPPQLEISVILPTSVIQGIRDAGRAGTVAGLGLAARLAGEKGEVVQWVWRE